MARAWKEETHAEYDRDPRVYRLHWYGGLKESKPETVPLPEPGDSEVRVRETPKLTAQAGYEVSGVVEAVGAGVTGPYGTWGSS